MNLHRRALLRSAGGLAVLLATSLPSVASTYPSRSLRWIVGFAPGGAADIVARIVAASLSHRLGQQVLIENKPGAGTNLATRAVIDAPPDGHTLLLTGSSTIVNALLQERHHGAILQEIAPVANLTVSAFVVVVNSSVPEATLGELIAFAKANPGKLRMGSYGIGTQSHLAAQLFGQRAGIDTLHIPYRGGAPLLGDLLGGHIQVGFDTVSSSLPHIRSGALRALAVTSAARVEALPDIPAAAETLPGYDVVAWMGVGVRKGTPIEIFQRLNYEIGDILADPEIGRRFSDLSLNSIPCSLAECDAFWSTDIRRALRLIQDTGLRLE
jgi:tripartite-type tricarboxylate transporter receptor subunit TctC